MKLRTLLTVVSFAVALLAHAQIDKDEAYERIYHAEHAQDSVKRVYDIVAEMPKFPGGNHELMSFIEKNKVYPAVAIENGVQGRVVVAFVVEADGSLTDIQVVRSVDPSLDREAVRVVSCMPKWIPGKEDGRALAVRYNVPVSFRIDPYADLTSDVKDGKKRNKPATGFYIVGLTNLDMNPLIIVDGKPVDPTVFTQLSISDIDTFEVVKNPLTLMKYGDAGQYGVILITTKKRRAIGVPIN